MAYKVKKITEGTIVIRNKTFSKDEIVEVSKDMFEYINIVFPTLFEVIENKETKVATKKQEVTSVKPKASRKKDN